MFSLFALSLEKWFGKLLSILTLSIMMETYLMDVYYLHWLLIWVLSKKKSLKNRIPFLRKKDEKIEIPKNPQLINLSTLHVPLSTTFGLFNNNSSFLVDPNLKEEKVCEGFIIISANKYNELCYIHTYSSIKVEKEIVDEYFYILNLFKI